jgi:hypothetical protein
MKRILFIFTLCSLLYSCNTDKSQTDPDKSPLVFKDFPLEVDEERALMARWEEKTVIKSSLIDDFETEKGWQVSGIGEMSYTNERSRDGNRSFRFRTSLRDEEYYKKNRSEWNSFNGRQGGSTYIGLTFDDPQDWTEYNRISFWIYVHPTTMPTYCIYIRMTCEDAIHTATDYNGISHFVQDLKPGEWNHVMFEIPHLQRDRVTNFNIYQMLRGHNPEEEGIVTYDIDQLEIQSVETDMYEGWEVERDKFSYSHIGYLPEQAKVAFAGFSGGDIFEVLNLHDEVVFKGNVAAISNKQGTFRALDFSAFDESGVFKLKYGERISNPFPVDRDIWIQPLFKTINFFFCQRCGYHVPGVHLECHKDWQGFYGDIKKVINGGWHDAGDLSQGSWRTAMSSLAMMMNLERLEEKAEFEELSNRIRDELAWGIEWLLKTRFGDGYHMSFSVMRIYTDNEIGTIDDVVSPAMNVPWENFLAATVQAKAAMMLKDSHPDLANQCAIAADEDWEAAFNSRDAWDEADYREASWGASASLLLAEMTGSVVYLEHAVNFGSLLVKCQEQQFVDDIPITGYFYTSSDKKEVIHNRHAAFEEAPLIALASLCKKMPDHKDWMQWYSAATLHSEFFMKRGSKIAEPFDLLPNSVWKKSEVEAIEEDSRREDMMRQFMDGTSIGDGYVLRTFPIYYDALFHGNTNIHMSSTWALAEASRLRKDAKGMQLAGKQFQWLFGANPFSQSLMYGEGNDFAPHFAYCLKDLVGALPVGMDCMSGDDPQWSATNTATYKEIWVEPVNRFMGALAVYLSDPDIVSVKVRESPVNISFERTNADSDEVVCMINTKNDMDLSFMMYNLENPDKDNRISLNQNNSRTAKIELKILDPHKPYIALVSDVNDMDQRWEAVGAKVELNF